MSATTTEADRAEDKGVTLSEKLRVEWPVLVTLAVCFLYMTNILSDMRLSLARLEARQTATESIVPAIQLGASNQEIRLNNLAERVTRIEATQPK